jgi:sec-independent protein translocase protein TatA
MPFNIGGGELIFVLVIVLIVFGAGKMPEVLGQLGRGMRTFREEVSGEGTTKSAPTDQPKQG